MKTLKLQVGKTYRSRAGEEVRIVEYDGDPEYPYRGSDGEWYTESGSYWHRERPEDLIEEVEELPETRHTFDVPDGVKKVTVEQVGNRIVVEMVPEERKEPKPGDVMVNDGGSVYIFKEVYDDYTHNHYAWLGTNGRLTIDAICNPGRPATSEEAQPLFDALKKAGKRWNPETMEVEEIPEKEKIEKFLEGYADGAIWSREQLRWLMESYLKHREGKK
jgi:hypothetical protein